VITWDHRGLHESGPPNSERVDAGAQAEDAVAVLDHFGIERAVMASWSNGARIAIEIADRYPDRIQTAAMISPAFGYRLTALLRAQWASLLPTAAGVGKHFASWLEGPFRTLVSRPELAGLIRQSGMVGPTADISALVDLMRGIAACDLRVLLATFEAVVGDPSPELLSRIEQRNLLVIGERDQFTSRDSIEGLAEAMSAELKIYEGATHYLPIEYPARLSDDLRSFFASA
jgi:3-oxoadipate enol-lactonase